MSIIQAAGSGEVSTGLYDFVIENSLRFQPDGNTNAALAADNPYLTATMSESNGTIWTFSCWVKLADLSTNRYLLQGFQDTSNYTHIYVANSNKIVVYSAQVGQKLIITTTPLLLDTNSWYHIVVKFNGTSGSLEIKVYVNGVNQAYTSAVTFVAHQSLICNSNAHYIGNAYNYVRDMAGYMAEVNLIDGTALDADSFGETKNGIWIPKDTSGLTFGDNGFRLQFKQTGTDGDENGIGADTSGKSNHFAVGDTDGLGASDVVPDSPTNNFATYNVLNDNGKSVTYEEGNLAVTASGTWSTDVWLQGSIGVTGGAGGGKYYFEFVTTLQGSGQVTGVGVQNSKATASTLYTEGVVYYNTVINANGSSVITGLTNNPASNVLRFAFDASNGKVWIGNSTGWYNSGDPANGTGEVGTIDNYDGSILVPITNRTSTSGTHTFNFGQDSSFAGLKTSGSANGSDANSIGDFYYDPPSGFLAMCSSNLPSPVITDGSEHFTPYIYTANNASTRSFTGLGFQADFLWFKARSQAFSHRLFNSVVGVGTHAYADRTDRPAWDSLTSFDADGFSVETDGTAGNLLNYSTSTYVAWAWKAGTTASGSESGNNPAFSSSSNADAGFSIVSYTGTGSAGTVSHGCGAKPTMIMIKNRSADENWAVYHAGTASDPETDYMILNTVAAAADSANWWNDTAPTDSVFTVGTDHTVNADGEDYIAYCFADVDGYMKASHYFGSNTTPKFVHTGFRPAFLMLKKTTQSTTYGWQIYDTSRSPTNVSLLPGMWADTHVVEAANTYSVNIHSNGFRLTGAGDNQNAAGVRYVYLAIADQPAKFNNAR